MKFHWLTKFILCLGVALLPHAVAQPAQSSPADQGAAREFDYSNQRPQGVPEPAPYDSSGPIGMHHRLIEAELASKSPTGEKVTETNSYTLLSVGMNYFDESGWHETKEAFTLTPNGAVALGAHKVLLAPDIHSAGSVSLTSPEGYPFRGHPAFLAYSDLNTHQMAVVAETVSSIGVQVAENQILYPSAFSGIAADIRYVFSRSSFEQDVVLREQIPGPEEFGLGPESVLQAWFEVVESAIPSIEEQDVLTQTQTFVDERLKFGSLQFVHGRAFSLGDDSGLNAEKTSIPVVKSWMNVGGRQFLVESIHSPQLQPLLQALPAKKEAKNSFKPQNIQKFDAKRMAQMLPTKLLATKTTNEVLMAKAELKRQPGVVLDFATVVTASGVRFDGNTTYLVTNGVTLSGETVLEGGTVVKFQDTNSSITLNGPLTCLTSSTRPAILTAKRDETVGESLGSGSLTGYYGNPALKFNYVTAPSLASLENVFIRYAKVGVQFAGGVGHQVWHAQFVNCEKAVQSDAGSDISFHNVLFVNSGEVFGGTGGTNRGENLSINQTTTFNGGNSNTVYLTNSLLYLAGTPGSYSGVNNSKVSSSPFQTVGAGSSYLADSSIYRNAGTTNNVNTRLLADLSKRTTYPPVVLTGTLAADTILSPRVQRDGDAPDLGYHPWPLDYVLNELTLTNVTLCLTNGVAIGYCGSAGLNIQSGGRLISEGTPLAHNLLVRYVAIQDQPTLWGTATTTLISGPSSAYVRPEVRLRFTDMTISASPRISDNFLDVSTCSFTNFSLTDCQMLGGTFAVKISNDAATCFFGFTNNLIQQCKMSFTGVTNNVTVVKAVLRNNTFLKGTLNFTHFGGAYSNDWQVFDNLFDTVSLSQSGTVTNGYNGHVNTTALSGGYLGGNKFVAPIFYATGPLGDYYLPSNSPLLNAGSTNATNVGLFHYTTQWDQSKEGDGTVDMGYHYIAVQDGGYTASGGFSETQGKNNWYYNYSSSLQGLPGGAMTVWDSTAKYWHHSGDANLAVWPTRQHPGGLDSIRTWVAPRAGTILITGSAINDQITTGLPNGRDGTLGRILQNSTALIGWTTFAISNLVTMNTSATVQLGDQIHFQLNLGTNVNGNYDSTLWDPTIVYTDGTAYQASTGFGSPQGTNNWFYRFSSLNKGPADGYMSIYTNAPWVRWDKDAGQLDCAIWNTGAHPGSPFDTIRTFIAPKTGRIQITSQFANTHIGTGDGVQVRIVRNKLPLTDWSYAANNGVYSTLNVNAMVQIGDEIHFQLNSFGTINYDSTTWDPTITYLASAISDAPRDSNGDGVVDYIADGNGNGVLDTGERVVYRPVLSFASSTTNYTERATPVVVDSGAVVTLPGATTLGVGKLTFQIVSGANANDRLMITNQGSSAGQIGYNPANGLVAYAGDSLGNAYGGTNGAPLVVSITTNGTPAAIQALVRRIIFDNRSHNPGNTNRVVQAVLTDGVGASSLPAVKTIAFTVIDEPPILRLSAGLTQVIKGGPPELVDPAGRVDDVDTLDYNSGTLKVSVPTAASLDSLSVRHNGSNAGQIGVLPIYTNSAVSYFATYGGIPFGDIRGGNGTNALIVDFTAGTAAVPSDAVGALIRSIQYQAGTTATNNSTQSVYFQVFQDSGAHSSNLVKLVKILPASQTNGIGGGGDIPLVGINTGVALHGAFSVAGGGANVHYWWSKVSGPGAVSFVPADALDTTAYFSTDGMYVVRIAATLDGSSAVQSQDFTVRVTDGTITSPLRVTAGQPFEVILPSGQASVAVQLQGLVSGATNTTVIRWSDTNQTGATFSSVTNPAATVTFTQVGKYVFTLTASSTTDTNADTTTVTVCRQEEAPVNIMFIVDHSLSMLSSNRIEEVKAAMTTFCELLNFSKHQIGVVSFGQTAGIELSLNQDKEKTIRSVHALAPAPGSGSNLELGLPLAVQELVGPRANPAASPIVIVLSDGGVSASQAVTNAAEQAKLAGVRIMTVLINQPGTNEAAVMRGIASSTNDYFRSSTPAELISLMAGISRSFCYLPNMRPLVYAGPDQSFRLNLAAHLSGVVRTDAATHVTNCWSVVVGNTADVSFGTNNDPHALVTFKVSTNYTLRLTATDTSNGSNYWDEVNFAISENSPPVVRDGYFIVDAGSTNNSIPVLNTVIDPDGDPLVITNVTIVSGSLGSVSVAPGGKRVFYTPVPKAGGTTHDFVSKVTDGKSTVDVTTHIFVRPEPLNFPPVAGDDTFYITNSTTDMVLDVLRNDYDPDDFFMDRTGSGETKRPLQIVNLTQPSAPYTNAVRIVDDGAGGTSLRYVVTSNPPTNTTLAFTYQVSDRYGATSSNAAVTLRFYSTDLSNSPPVITGLSVVTQQFNNPTYYVLPPSVTDDGFPITGGALAPLTYSWSVDHSDGLDFYDNGWNSTPNPEVIFNQMGQYVFTLVASDGDKYSTNTFTMKVTENTLVAKITNIPNETRITQGRVAVQATARDTAAIHSASYVFNVYEYGSSTVIWTYPETGLTYTDGTDLSPTLDFTRLRNGIYTLELAVSKGGATVKDERKIILDSNVKIGQLSFTVQDLSIPVQGIPITLTRTYDSYNPNGGSFGAGWTYALCDIDAQFDEEREWVNDSDTIAFSRRSGGGRNLVLTLPDGRRSAFQFAPVARGYVQGYYAEWQATGGVYAKLTPHGNDYIATVPFLDPYWQATGPGVTLDQYDMPGFDLTLPDGTVMVIERDDGGEHLMDLEGIYLHTYQNAHVAQVRRPNGATLDINQNGVSHRLGTNQSGAAIWFVRDSAGRITEVRDPRSGPGTDQPPVLKYVYDSTNNLTKVIKLVSPLNATARYETNQYFYTNTAFPHLITLMLDARGVTNSVSQYYTAAEASDSTGKAGTLKSIIDARGVSNSFAHVLDDGDFGREEVTRTEGTLWATTTNYYDARGNVWKSISPFNLVTATEREFDSLNNLTQEKISPAAGGLGYMLTDYTHDARGNVIRTIKYPVAAGGNPLPLTTTQKYNAFGQVTEVIEPNGNAEPDHPDIGYSTRLEYDSLGNLTKVVDGLNDTNSYGYNSLQLAESETNAVGVVTRYTYDALGYLASRATYTNGTTLQSLVTYETDANGNRLSETVYKSRLNPAVSGGLILESFTTRYQYDYQNRLVATIDALGNTNSTVYNALGKVGQTTDAMGHSTAYYYDPVGDLVGTVYADTAQALTFRGVITLSGSDYYRVVVTEDPHKGTEPKIGTRSYLDSLGRVYQTERLTNLVINVATNGEVWTTTFGSAGAVPGTLTTTVYDNAGRVLSVADPMGIITGYEYDSANRRVNATQTNSVTGATLRIHTEYDLTGNAVATWQVGTNGIAGPVTQQLYDSLNRVTNSFLVQSNGSYLTLRSTVYDALGRKRWEADGDGIASGFQYDGLGHLIAVTNAVGTALQSTNYYVVDEMGGLLVQQDAAGKQIRSEFDALGRRYSRMLPHGETEYWLYNGDGTVKQHQDFNGTNVVFSYDGRDRLLNKKKVGDASPYVTFTYNGNGQRLSMSDGTLTTSYTYEEVGRLKTKSMPAGVLTYAYNGRGQVTNAVSSSSSGYAVGYGYDGFGRLSSVTANSQTSTYLYDPWSRLLSQANSPFTQSYGYNGFGQVTTQMFQNGGTVELMFSNVTYSAGGRRMGQNELIASHATRNILWNYDMLGRLISETFTNVSSTPGGIITYNSGSGYDMVGNRQQRTSTVTGISTVSSTFFGNDQVNPDGYDANGNTTAQGSNNYKYDQENRMTNAVVGGVTNVIIYDGDGIRLKKTSGSTVTWYLVDDQTPTGYAQVVEEKATTNGTPDVVYTYGLRLISHSQSGTTYYYASDIHGSTRAVYASNGTRLVAFSYDAFGNVVDLDGSTSPSISRRYNTEEWDFNLSLYNLRARTFNTDLGRFMNRDSIEGSLQAPASQHQYLYTANDPVNKIDPTGHMGVGDFVLSMSIRIGIAAQTYAPVINAARITVSGIFLSLMTFNEQFRNDAAALGPNMLGEALSEAGMVVYELRGMALNAIRVSPAVVPEMAKLGDTVLKGVADDTLIHFIPSDKVKAVTEQGLRYLDGGVGTHFFKASEMKLLTQKQAAAAIGDLAGSSQEIGAVAIVSRGKLSTISEFQYPMWTECVTRDQGVIPDAIRYLSDGGK